MQFFQVFFTGRHAVRTCFDLPASSRRGMARGVVLATACVLAWGGRLGWASVGMHVLLAWHTVRRVTPRRQPGRPGAQSHTVLLVLVFCLAPLLLFLCCLLQARIMRQDWSWNRPALDYVELYYSCTKE